MLDLFRSLFTFFRRRRTHTDCLIFRLHHRLTVTLLLIFCVVVGFRQYWWSPIMCYSGNISKDLLNAYCWTHSTFTFDIKSDTTGGTAIAPGVYRDLSGKTPRRYHRYYQWVVLCLFFQAVLFYIPRWLWIGWEGGKLQKLKNNLSSGSSSEEEKLKRSENVLEYLNSNLSRHQWWAMKYYFCEFLALVNVIGQMFLMDRFLGGVFWTYGSEVLSFLETDSEERVDPMIAVFPEITKCLFRIYGSSGFPEPYEALCVLPLNILNQKFYVFLWFWCLILLVLTSLCLLYRLSILKYVRLRMYLMRIRYKNIRRSVVDSIASKIRSGDWFLLYLLGENVDPDVFRELMQEFSQRLSNKEGEKIEFNEVL